MNPRTQRRIVEGPVGAIECAVDVPAGDAVGTAVICHPHPLGGGTMDNKVVQTLARALIELGWVSIRFNYRGVGASAGSWSGGEGEVADTLAVIDACVTTGQPLVLAGFSFGAYAATQAAAALPVQARPRQLVLVGPSTEKQALGDVPSDTVVIHGAIDDVVPLQSTFDWALSQSLPVIVFPGTGHFFHGQLGLLKSVVIRELASRRVT